TILSKVQPSAFCHVRFQRFPASCLPVWSHSQNSSTLAIRRAFIRFAKASTTPPVLLCLSSDYPPLPRCVSIARISALRQGGSRAVYTSRITGRMRGRLEVCLL